MVWDIGEGVTVLFDGMAPGDRIIKEGAGTLLWGEAARAAHVDMLAGALDFSGGRTAAEINLSGGVVTGGFMESPVVATGGALSGYVWAPLMLPGGAVFCDDAHAGYSLTVAGATLRGHLIAESGIWIAPVSEPSRIEGHLELSAGSSLSWSMQDSLEVAPLIVTGTVSSIYSEIRLYFGLVDWSQPYWETQRDYLFVDAREGGIVTSAIVPDPYAGNEDWGSWSRVPTVDGDIVLRWTPLAAARGTAAVPEASAAPWAAVLAAAALAYGRVSRRGERGAARL